MPKFNLPDRFVLFHWSPSDRRKSITRSGLKINQRSTDRLWKPPYISFGDYPDLAWDLSAGRDDYDNRYTQWDLWCVRSVSLEGFETLSFNNDTEHEFRVYQDIPKKDVWFVGTRTLLGEKEVVSGTS